MPLEQLFSAASYPPRAITPLASEMAKDLTNFNWWGRTALHLREGKERSSHLEGLILGIKMELDVVTERRVALIEEKKRLEKTTTLYHEMMAQLEEKSAEERELTREIREMRDKNSVIRAGLEVHSQIKARVQHSFDNSRPPSTTPQPGPHSKRATPLITEERPLLDESSDDDLDVGKVSPMRDDIEEDEVEKREGDE